MKLRLWWRRLWGWELTLCAVLPDGRTAWSVPGVASYRVRDGRVHVVIAGERFLADAVFDIPEGARLAEFWSKRGRGKPTRYGM